MTFELGFNGCSFLSRQREVTASTICSGNLKQIIIGVKQGPRKHGEGGTLLRVGRPRQLFFRAAACSSCEGLDCFSRASSPAPGQALLPLQGLSTHHCLPGASAPAFSRSFPQSLLLKGRIHCLESLTATPSTGTADANTLSPCPQSAFPSSASGAPFLVQEVPSLVVQYLRDDCHMTRAYDLSQSRTHLCFAPLVSVSRGRAQVRQATEGMDASFTLCP